MADCIHLYIRKGLHNSAATLICWREWEKPETKDPGDCDGCPFAVIRQHLDISTHPLAVRWTPPHTGRPHIPWTELIELCKNE